MPPSLMQFEVDAKHGGRWTSIKGRNGREWLWANDIPGRDTVVPGASFVDAGGLEECFPTITGEPDHGDVWSRPWQADGDRMSVTVDHYRLERRIEVSERGIVASYRLEGEPGYAFIWAAHALIDVSGAARLHIPSARPFKVDTLGVMTGGGWPHYEGTDLSRLNASDGSATMIIVPELTAVTVVDGDDCLTMTLAVQGQPCGVAIWRNLGGWPEDRPYRSIAVEPMLGHFLTLSKAPPGQTAVIPPSGLLTWTMTLDA